MFMKLLGFLMRWILSQRDVEIKALKSQLENARFLNRRAANDRCVLIDELADLRKAYGQLQYARLEDFRLTPQADGEDPPPLLTPAKSNRRG